MKLLLRLGCALLACAGIAASRAAAAPAEGTPAQRRAPERIVETAVEPAGPGVSERADLSARPARRAGPSFRSVASPGGRAVRAAFAFAGFAARRSSPSVPALLADRASPRGPPASA